jgi:hypothetical protein
MIKFDFHNVTQRRLFPNIEDCPLTKVLDTLPVVNEALIEKKCWVAGGFIRRWYSGMKQDSDIDLFFHNEETYIKICEGLEKLAIEPPKITEFNQMYKIKIDDTWTIDVQAIKHQFYENIDALLDSFDFTICQFAFDGNQICATEEAILDCNRKRLAPHKISYGVSSLRRIIKYANQGYYMCGGAATEFLNQIVAQPSIVRGNVISID